MFYKNKKSVNLQNLLSFSKIMLTFLVHRYFFLCSLYLCRFIPFKFLDCHFGGGLQKKDFGEQYWWGQECSGGFSTGAAWWFCFYLVADPLVPCDLGPITALFFKLTLNNILSS